jgi:hypothetical protein
LFIQLGLNNPLEAHPAAISQHHFQDNASNPSRSSVASAFSSANLTSNANPTEYIAGMTKRDRLSWLMRA